ncbi:MAG: metallophosphoesterase [Clostridia bacterium]|nr:metallophosphoesterase [Clostridia bacterium]
MKKFLSVVLSVVMVLSMSLLASAEAPAGDVTLSFSDDGKFKIMNICDIQDDYPLNPATVTFVCEALDAAQPDIVVLGGDNVELENAHEDGFHAEGPCDAPYCSNTKVFDQVVAPFVERNIPFTLVFGNHDSQGDKPTREWQLKQYQRAGGDLCLAYDAVEELHGCATHNLPVMSSDNSKVAFNLWMFDCGDYVFFDDGTDAYDCVRKDQLDWYKQVSTQLEKDNGGKVPSIAFQHIIVEEIFNAVFFKCPPALSLRKFDDGTAYSFIPNMFKFSGIMYELPCPSVFNDGQWDAFVERGDVLGCVTGHDHVNSFIATYKGIDIIQSPSASFESYSDNTNRGVRMFTIDEKNPWTYETDILTSAEIAVMEGSKLPEASGMSVFAFKVFKFFHDFLNMLMDIIVVKQ